ncbi:MAG: phosphodiesterase [Butyrivibrio sp.]|nr:phosphodiesterase [Butyrivibrio sp.]
MDIDISSVIYNDKKYNDELTGLLNLNGVLNYITEKRKDVTSGKPVIIYLNIMNFKAFNQQYGFAGGNEYLKGLSNELKKVFEGDVIGRVSGDQFVVLSKEISQEEIVNKLSELRTAAHRHAKALFMRIKAGIYISEFEDNDPVIMIDRAKIACDEIMRVYDKNDNFYDDNLKKKNDLRQYIIDNFENAFKQHYFKVFYQKEVRALTGKVCGYEALARWIDPVYGMISPALFVEILEEVHLVHKLDLYIIENVCRELRDDIEYGKAILPVSVNLSRLDFQLCDIKEEIDKCRAKYDIPTYLLNIEITESAIASGESFLGDQIKNFRESGYQVWMDDFGAGYSSLNNLKVYDFDVLKIDMNFLRSFETNKKSKVILATIVNMAKELGMHTLAEGVETKEQYEFLRDIGCEKLQGYLFGKPIPVEDFVKPDDYSYNNCEDLKFKTYYRRIGDINLLSSSPLKDKDMVVINNLPIAISEIENESTHTIYANKAYEMFLSSIGIKSLVRADERSENKTLKETKSYFDTAREAENAENHMASVDLAINGHIVNLQLRFLARESGKAAFAIVARNMTLSGDDKRTFDDIRVAMAHLFNQYFRVDLYDDEGNVENIYLNADQLAVAEKKMNAKKAVEIYSNIYLYPQDRERFRKFYNISTVHERLKKWNRDFLVDFFHSAIPGDRGRMQMYMILPFYYNDRWKYISCCRYADEIAYQFTKGQKQ